MASLHIAEQSRRRRLRWQAYLVAVVLLVCWLCGGRAAGASISATLDRDTITLGESATLSLTVSGGGLQATPAPPEIPTLQIQYVGQSSQVTINNGAIESSVTYNFSISAREPGSFLIPAISMDLDGEKVQTRPLRLRVLKPQAAAPEAINSGDQLAFARLVVPRKEVYVGETFVAQLQICLGGRVQRYSQPQLANGVPADGFNLAKNLAGEPTQAQFGQAAYRVLPYNLVFKAVKAGPLSIGPIPVTMVVELANPNRRRDLFDPFGMFGGGGERKQISFAAEAVAVQSLPLPREHVPASFNGAIGEFTMNVTAGPTNVAVGDPVTLRVQISGHGSLDSVMLPEQAWGDFKLYPATSKVEASDQLELQGVKTFEQLLAPQSPEVKAIPPITFSFFDPGKKKYETLTQPAIPLSVRPGGSAPVPTVLAASRPGQDNSPPAQDIVPNKQRLGALAQIGPPLVQQPWFLALQAVPVLALVSAIVWRKRSEALANNPRLRRQRRVAQIVHEGLAELKRLAAANQAEAFFATLMRLLQEQIGERLDLPATAILEAVVDERLRPAGVPEDILQPLRELFNTCNLARYAPIKTSQELAALIPKAEAVLRDLAAIQV